MEYNAQIAKQTSDAFNENLYQEYLKNNPIFQPLLDKIEEKASKGKYKRFFSRFQTTLVYAVIFNLFRRRTYS